jgi:hypothetical protein
MTAIELSLGVVLLGRIECQAVLDMLVSGREGAGVVRGGPQRMMGLEQEPGVAALLGYSQKVLAELPG